MEMEEGKSYEKIEELSVIEIVERNNEIMRKRRIGGRDDLRIDGKRIEEKDILENSGGKNGKIMRKNGDENEKIMRIGIRKRKEINKEEKRLRIVIENEEREDSDFE